MAHGPARPPARPLPAGQNRHVSETQDAASVPRWRTGDLDVSAFTWPPDPRGIAQAGAAFEGTVPGVRPARDGQFWVDVILVVAGIAASVIMLPVWLSVALPAIFSSQSYSSTGSGQVFVIGTVTIGILMWVFVAGAIWGLSRILRKRSGRPLVWWRLSAFAAANGLGYRPWASATTITTSLVRGRNKFWLEDRLQPLDVPTDLTVATLVVEGDSGNFSLGERRWGFVELRLDRSLPHIVVETTERTRAESDFGILPGQSFELEGDFPRFARVYADEDDRRTALELLTPDVMAAIVDEAAGYDLEVRGDRLAIVSPVLTDIADAGTLARMFRMAAIIGSEARRVSAQRGDGRYVVEFAGGLPPERMRQRRVSRGAVRGFLISGIVIAVITGAAVILPALRG
jgi:hypothetical protein